MFDWKVRRSKFPSVAPFGLSGFAAGWLQPARCPLSSQTPAARRPSTSSLKSTNVHVQCPVPDGVMGLKGRARAKFRFSWSGFRLQPGCVLPWRVMGGTGRPSLWPVSSALHAFASWRWAAVAAWGEGLVERETDKRFCWLFRGDKPLMAVLWLCAYYKSTLI